MKEQYKHLPLRSGVGIVVINQEDKIFVARRIDNPKDFWQMPQGGINKGCLLYTSPSPRDMRRSRMPSSA